MTDADTEFQSWFLNCNRNHKLNVLRDALIQKELGVFMGLVDILLEAPIHKGGLSTSTLQQAFGPDLSNPNFHTHGERFPMERTQRPSPQD